MSEQPRKVNNGVLLFCSEGNGDITIDLNHYLVCKDTSIILIPGSIFFIEKTSDDLRLHYFSCSLNRFQNACFRLPPAFIHFLKENSCYTHTCIDTHNAIAGLTATSTAITRQIGGQAAKSIIDRHLILELKVALQSTELSLKEIADRYGFPDQSFFGRYFKKHTGMSPKEFRGQKE